MILKMEHGRIYHYKLPPKESSGIDMQMWPRPLMTEKCTVLVSVQSPL